MGFFNRVKNFNINRENKDPVKTLVEHTNNSEPVSISDDVESNVFIPSIRALEKSREILIDRFQKAVDERYKKVFSADPTPFRMIQSENLEMIYFHLDLNKSNADEDYVLLFYNPNKVQDVSIYIPTDEDYEDFYKYTSINRFVLEVIRKNKNLNESDLVYTTYIFKSFFKAQSLSIDEYIINDFTHLQKRLDDTIKAALQEYQTHMSKEVSYYAKNAALYSYTLLDLKPIIIKVNNEDFTYQLDEAIAAYDHSLYTASATLLGVAIETMCVQILKNNSQKVKDSDATMIDKLANRLKENNLITRKEHGRLDVAYKVRNLAAHSSSGKTIQSDCHFLISVIHDMVENHF